MEWAAKETWNAGTIVTSPVFPMAGRALLVLGASVAPGRAAVYINEVADKGGGGACGDGDWVEVHNDGASAAAVGGYALYDQKGPDAADAYVFPAVAQLAAGAYSVYCTGAAHGRFGVGSFDVITLADAGGAVLSTAALDGDGEPGVALARRDDGTYAYTSSATPGAANVETPIVGRRQRLAAQDAAGDWFFGMHADGTTIAGSDPIARLDVAIAADDWASARPRPSPRRGAVSANVAS